MATSQNGWPVIVSGSEPRLTAIPKIIGRVRAGDVATVFSYLVSRFDAEVEDVDVGADDWGYAFRAIRGVEDGYSNHASGTAIDLNAMRHPLGAVGTFTPAQRAAISRILADLGGVVRWGGNYSGRKDEMHFELVASAAAVALIAARIRGGQLVGNIIGRPGTVGSVPAVSGPAPIQREEFVMATAEEVAQIVAAQVAPLVARIGTLEAAVGAVGSARWYKIEGTTLAWLDLGTCRRRGTAQQYAADPSGVVALRLDDPFWRLPIVGPAWGGESYRKPGETAAWFPNIQSGIVVREYPGRQGWIDAGSPPILDLPATHPFWNLPVNGPLPSPTD